MSHGKGGQSLTWFFSSGSLTVLWMHLNYWFGIADSKNGRFFLGLYHTDLIRAFFGSCIETQGQLKLETSVCIVMSKCTLVGFETKKL